MARDSRPSAASDLVLGCRASDVNPGGCASHVDRLCKSQAWPRRVRIVAGRKIHDVHVDSWADLLDLAHVCHAAIFRIENRIVLAEMHWQTRFWGTA